MSGEIFLEDETYSWLFLPLVESAGRWWGTETFSNSLFISPLRRFSVSTTCPWLPRRNTLPQVTSGECGEPQLTLDYRRWWARTRGSALAAVFLLRPTKDTVRSGIESVPRTGAAVTRECSTSLYNRVTECEGTIALRVPRVEAKSEGSLDIRIGNWFISGTFE